jgi:uncharacterized membrane-anchored protein YhcB (DUF1043 family)
MLWLMSNAVCVLIGFFIARLIDSKDGKKKAVQPQIKQISEEEKIKRERELKEFINMMTYDGTPQEKIK